MNKLLLLLVLSTVVCFHSSKAQTEMRYLVGIEGNGGISRINNQYGKNVQLNVTAKLYAGKFISSKTAIYASFGFDNYRAYKTTSHFLFNIDTVSYKYYEYIITPMFNIGVRKYYSVIKKDIVGLFTDFEIGYGKTVKRLKNKMYYTSQPQKQQSTETSNVLSTNVLLGAYLNVGRNWQILLKLGGFYYSHNGKKDRNSSGRYFSIPEKGSSVGISFNPQYFQLSFARIL
jgi:hypothetical protein